MRKRRPQHIHVTEQREIQRVVPSNAEESAPCQEQKSVFLDLPPELLLNIINKLSDQERRTLGQTCINLYGFVQQYYTHSIYGRLCDFTKYLQTQSELLKTDVSNYQASQQISLFHWSRANFYERYVFCIVIPSMLLLSLCLQGISFYQLSGTHEQRVMQKRRLLSSSRLLLDLPIPMIIINLYLDFIKTLIQYPYSGILSSLFLAVIGICLTRYTIHSGNTRLHNIFIDQHAIDRLYPLANKYSLLFSNGNRIMMPININTTHGEVEDALQEAIQNFDTFLSKFSDHHRSLVGRNVKSMDLSYFSPPHQLLLTDYLEKWNANPENKPINYESKLQC